MHTNPHPKMISDEASGIKVTNQRYDDWEDGYLACWGDIVSDADYMSFLKLLARIRELGIVLYDIRTGGSR